MKRVRFHSILLFLLCRALPLLSQVNSPNQPEPPKEAPVLDGRPLVDIEVLVLAPSEMAAAGFDTKLVISSVKSLFAENNIKSMSNIGLGDQYDPKSDPLHANNGRLVIDVHIIQIQGESRVAYYCEAQFREWLSPLRKEAGYVQFAVTWGDSASGTVGLGRITDLRECVMELAHNFALRYLRDNQATDSKP